MRDRKSENQFLAAAPPGSKRHHLGAGIPIVPYVVGYDRREGRAVLAVRRVTLSLFDRRIEDVVIGPTGPGTVASGMASRRAQHGP